MACVLQFDNLIVSVTSLSLLSDNWHTFDYWWAIIVMIVIDNLPVWYMIDNLVFDNLTEEFV